MHLDSIEETVIYEKLSPEGNGGAGSTEREAFQPDGRSTPGGTADSGVLLSQSLESMEMTKVHYPEYNMPRPESFLPVKIVRSNAKKVIRKCTDWALESVFERQTVFNSAALDSIRQLDEKIQTAEKQQKIHIQLQSGRHSQSQSGEDVIIAYILSMLGIPEKNCSYLDLGANHAKKLSNTYYFYGQGARGVLVEANPVLIPELKLYREEDRILNCCISDREGETIDFYVLNGDGLSTPDKARAEEVIAQNPALRIDRVVPVKTMSVNRILEENFEEAPVYMNIDIEGDDLKILSSIDWEKWRPLIVTAETIPYQPNLVVGEKDGEIVRFMESIDYTEYAFTGINSIFLDKRRL